MLIPIVHYWYLSWVLLFLPFHGRGRWIVAAMAMVTYFEGVWQRTATGVWSMPPESSLVVWGAFLLAWAMEAGVNRHFKSASSN